MKHLYAASLFKDVLLLVLFEVLYVSKAFRYKKALSTIRITLVKKGLFKFI